MVNFTTKRPGAKRSGAGKASESKNWREDSANLKGMFSIKAYCRLQVFDIYREISKKKYD